MLTLKKERVLLKKGITLNSHVLLSGQIIAKNKHGIYTCIESFGELVLFNAISKYDSGFGYGDNENTDKCWNIILEMIKNSEAEFIYEEYTELEDGEIPETCFSCPNMGYMFPDNEKLKRRSCYLMSFGNVFKKGYNIEAINFEEHFNNKTKPKACPLSPNSNSLN